MATQNSTLSESSPQTVNRITLVTAQRTTYATVGYGTSRRAEVRAGGRSTLAAWTHESLWNAVDALGSDTSVAETQPPAAIERKRAEMMAMVPGARDHRDAWQQLFARFVGTR